MEDSTLNRFEPVFESWNGTVKNDVRSVFKEPVLVRLGERSFAITSLA
jgi:hypothetical protein